MNIDSGEVGSIVALIALLFSYLGITGVDSTVINGFVNGVFAIIAFGAALWSWYSHRQKNEANS